MRPDRTAAPASGPSDGPTARGPREDDPLRSCYPPRSSRRSRSRRRPRPRRRPSAARPRPTCAPRSRRRLEIKVEDVRPSPIAGLYEVRSGAEVGYVSTDGRFYVDGDVFDMTSKQNLTERRAPGRAIERAGRRSTTRMRSSSRRQGRGEAHADGLHRRRLRVLPAHAPGNRRVQPSRLPRPLPDVSRAGGPGSVAWRKAEAVWCSAGPAGRADPREARRARSMRRSAANTPIAAQSRARRAASASAARPASSPTQASISPATLPAASMAEYLGTGGRRRPPRTN